MRRAGGWILGLVVVVGMAATAVLGLRPVLFRKTLVIEYPDANLLTAEQKEGIRLAFAGKNSRVGSFRVVAGFLTGQVTSRPRTHVLTLESRSDFWTARKPGDEQERFGLLPNPLQVGGQAAGWARRSGITRVFIAGSSSQTPQASFFEKGFQRNAIPLGIEFASLASGPQGRSLVDQIMAFQTELVLLDPSHGAVLIDGLRSSGYGGRFISYVAGPAREGELYASSFIPPPPTFAAKIPSTDYYAYLMTTVALEAIERAGTDDPATIYKSLAQASEFDAEGFSTLSGGLYVVRKGAAQFVEPLK